MRIHVFIIIIIMMFSGRHINKTTQQTIIIITTAIQNIETLSTKKKNKNKITVIRIEIITKTIQCGEYYSIRRIEA